MKAKQIQEKINNLNYWDSEVSQLSVNYFGDEVVTVFDNIKILFTGCSQVHIVTDPLDRKIPIKSMTPSQLHYYMQNIEVVECQLESSAVVYLGGNKFPEPRERFNLLKCKMLMPPLNIEICCNSIKFEDIKTS